MIGVAPPMVFLRHLDGAFAIQGPLRIKADGFQRGRGALAQLLVVVHHQHVPIRQDHVGLFHCGLFQIQRHMKFGALALERNGSAHGVHNKFGNGHPQARTLRALNPAAVLPGEGVKDLLLELLRHADAAVLHLQVRLDEILSPGRRLLV